MAETTARAFGRYMLALRERRGLSLTEVCRFFADSPESIDRGSLSRLERGRQGLSVGKIVTLSRIYGVSPEVVIERLELDRELDRQGEPPTEGMLFEELAEEGKRALDGQHSRWHAYACLRDALPLAGTEDDVVRVRLNLATAIRGLGKNRLALNELEDLERATRDTPLHPTVLDRISNCHRCLDHLEEAERFARAAAHEAEALGDDLALAYACTSLANVRMARGDDSDRVADYLVRALRAIRAPGDPGGVLRHGVNFEVMTLNMLAECHLLAGRDAAARRSALEASRLSQSNGLDSGRGYAALLLGRVAENRGQDDLAESRWHDAVSIARRLENKRLEFSAEFYLYRRAVRTGMQRRSEAGRRRLERLAPWVPEHLPLRIEFQEMSATPAERSGRPPIRQRHPDSPRPSRMNRSGEWDPRIQREERP